MKKYLIKNYPKTYKIYLKIRFYTRAFYRSENFYHVLWNIFRGDSFLSYNYMLNSNSIFVDVGGYEGEFSQRILEKFNCKIIIFEPLEDLYLKLKDRFSLHNNVIVENYAISDFNGSENIILSDESSSFYIDEPKNSNSKIIKKNVKVLSISSIFEKFNIEKIDYLKLNVEGAEYKILNELIKSKNINKVKNLQIQFHKISDNSINERKIIRSKLKKTHRNIFSFPFVWEKWSLRNI